MSQSVPAFTKRFVSKKETVQIIGSIKLTERMIAASKPGSPDPWLRFVPPPPGKQRRDSLIDVASVHAACDRLLAGEHPPLFPSEIKKRGGSK